MSTENYKLMRTIIPLSGQLEWAFDINATGLENFHIRPVSQALYYTPSRDFLMYAHQENIPDIYKKTKYKFFNNEIDANKRTWFPEITDHQQDTHDCTYEYGCSRVNCQRFGKSVKVFIPVWFGDLRNVTKVTITVNGGAVKNYRLHDPNAEKNTGNKNGNNYDDVTKESIELDPEHIIVRKSIIMDRNNIGTSDINQRMSKYFWNWIDYCFPNASEREDNIFQNFLMMSFAENRALINGVECTSGASLNKNVSSLIDNLTSRERPMMEQNNIITSQWKINEMICKQLFNFAVYFNIDELIHDHSIDFAPLLFTADVTITFADGTVETLRDADFLYNYDNIYKKQITFNDERLKKTVSGVQLLSSSENSIVTMSDSESNVYDYMQDNDCLDFSRSNKLIPSDIFIRNIAQETPFSLYDGFAPIIETGEETKSATAVTGTDVNTADNAWSYSNNAGIFLPWIVTNMDSTFQYDINKIFTNKTTSEELKLENLSTNETYNLTSWHGIRFNKFNSNLEDSGIMNMLNYNYIIGCMTKLLTASDNESENRFKLQIENVADKYYFPYYFTVVNKSVVIGIYSGQQRMLSDNDILLLKKFTLVYNIKKFINALWSDNEDSLTATEKETYCIGHSIPLICETSENKFEIKTFTIANNTDISNKTVSYSKYIKIYKDRIAADLMQNLLNFFNNINYPSVVFFNKGVSAKTANGPQGSTEVTYTKVDNQYKYLMRYDGKMVPFFVTADSEYYNYIYSFAKYADNTALLTSTYAQNMGTNWRPDYRSVGYYPLVSRKIIFNEQKYIEEVELFDNYRKLNNVEYYNFYSKYFDNNSSRNMYGEIKWYDDSLIYALPQQIEVTIDNDHVPSLNDLAEYLADQENMIGKLTYNKLEYFNIDGSDEPTDTMERQEWIRNQLVLFFKYYIINNYSMTYKQTADSSQYVILYKLI